MRRNVKQEERDKPEPPPRSITSESDISEDISQFLNKKKDETYIDKLDKMTRKTLKIDVSLESQRKQNDFYIYDKKISGGVKINEHCLIFSRKKALRQDVRVEANPLKLPNKLIYFEYECPF